jgi:hypothetical protein
LDVASKQTFAIRDLEGRLTDLLHPVVENEQTDIIRCIFSDFDTLSVEDQCSILRITRAAREMTSEALLQTVVVGAWNLFRLQAHWRNNYHNASPVPDRNHVFYDDTPDVDDILSGLREAELVSKPPSEYETTCAEMLLEATGGDEFLVNCVIDCLTAQRNRIEHLESAIAQTIDSSEVSDEFEKRWSRLTSSGRDLLISIVNHQFVSANHNDSDAEDLRLEGFVQTRPTDGLTICVSSRSIIVDAVLRANRRSWAVGGRPVYDGKDLARPNVALNTAAYKVISKIETTLRNMVVLSCGSEASWTERIQHVKTGAQDLGVTESEFAGLARQIQNALAPYLADLRFDTAADATPAPQPPGDGPVKRRKQISLIEAAEDWRKRNYGNTMLGLAGESLIYFITTEGLFNILTNKEIYSAAIEPFFPERSELKTFLEHYVAIRGAVAHNQPITLGTLKRLEEMRENLEKRIYRAVTRIGALPSLSSGEEDKKP